jgi:hypothetical protein
LRAEGEGVGGRDRIIDVAGFDGDEGVEEFGGGGEAGGPLRAGCGGENCAVVVQRFGERDGAEDGDAFPGAEEDVVDPAAIGAGDVALGPVMYGDGGAEVFGVSGGVRDAEKWVDRVAAAAVDHCAGWA